MKTYFLRPGWLIAVFVSIAISCKHDAETPPIVCRLASTTDQLVETSGKLTDEMQRTFTYSGGVLSSVTERSTSQNASFQVEYTANRIVRATSGQDVITLTYATGTSPTSSTFSRGGNVQSTFAMDYTPAGRMSRVVENRQTLPPGSLTSKRVFTFTYDNAGNLTLEHVQFTLTDGTVVDQETEYVVDQKPSPYSFFPELPLLTLVALSQAVETRPGRFWHINAPLSLKSYNVTSTGTRSGLRESSTFTPIYDTDNKLTNQDQNALLYQLPFPDPVTKKNRQAFVYQCQ